MSKILNQKTEPDDVDANANASSKKYYYCFLIIPCIGVSYIFINMELVSILKVLILFVSFYIILWIFPNISKSLYSRPLYIGDIENSRFEFAYIYVMNFVLSIGCAILFENWVIQRLIENKSILEITAIVGGNITFFGTIQNHFAKILLSFCHSCKLHEEARSRRNSQDNDDPGVAVDNDLLDGTNPMYIIHSPQRRSKPSWH